MISLGYKWKSNPPKDRQTSLRLLFSDLPDHQLVVAGGRVRFPGKGRALQLQQRDLRRGVHQAAGAQVSAQD